jgi:hypothetical protein
MALTKRRKGCPQSLGREPWASCIVAQEALRPEFIRRMRFRTFLRLPHWSVAMLQPGYDERYGTSRNLRLPDHHIVLNSARNETRNMDAQYFVQHGKQKVVSRKLVNIEARN